MKLRATGPLLALGLFLMLPACDDARGDAAAASAAAAEQTAAAGDAGAASLDAGVMRIHMSPTCGCCGDWVEHVEENGFETEVEYHQNVVPVKMEHRLPGHLASCHTAVVDGYVVEGHVPAEAVRRLLDERPEDVAGIAVPGMPMGSPGMEGHRVDPYDVIAFRKDGSQYVFESY